MLTLFYSPGACSLATHILLKKFEIPYQLKKVDLKTKLTTEGDDFRALSLKGYVPVLRAENGHVLTEGVAILSYLSAQLQVAASDSSKDLFGSFRLLEWLVYISTELHKGFSPLFGASRFVSEAEIPAFKQKHIKSLQSKFQFVNKQLTLTTYLTGNDFSAADAYLFTVLRWARAMKVNLEDCPKVIEFYNQVKELEYVKAALAEEGISAL